MDTGGEKDVSLFCGCKDIVRDLGKLGLFTHNGE